MEESFRTENTGGLGAATGHNKHFSKFIKKIIPILNLMNYFSQ